MLAAAVSFQCQLPACQPIMLETTGSPKLEVAVPRPQCQRSAEQARDDRPADDRAGLHVRLPERHGYAEGPVAAEDLKGCHPKARRKIGPHVDLDLGDDIAAEPR